MNNKPQAEGTDTSTAEKRAYARGYNAGKRRRQREISDERRWREQQAFLDRAFLALLPTAMTVQGWAFGGKTVSSSEDRIRLARIWAEKALKQRPIA